MVNPDKLRPPLKWAGGKRWLVPILKEIWQDYQDDHQLVEPFCGGLAITLGLAPKKATLNDVNPHLINFYQWLKKGLICTVEMANDSELYYEHRQTFNGLILEEKERFPEAAQLFYYLNRTGFNGLCRFNNTGQYNVPFGRYKKINYAADFLSYKPVLKNWSFELGDFEELNIESNSFIYADPPYDVEFRQYSAGGFSWEDQCRLVAWLSKQNVPVVLSNQGTNRIIELYESFGLDVEKISAPRRISRNGDRRDALEVLATLNTKYPTDYYIKKHLKSQKKAKKSNTGKMFEKLVLPVLEESDYKYEQQKFIGDKPNGRKHIVDLVIDSNDQRILVSKKWQQTGGTAEEKIPYEVIILARACREFDYDKAYLVLGGTDDNKDKGIKGWTLRQWYLAGSLNEFIQGTEIVHIIDTEEFIARVVANNL